MKLLISYDGKLERNGEYDKTQIYEYNIRRPKCSDLFQDFISKDRQKPLL
jgi:hypothetical protein